MFRAAAAATAMIVGLAGCNEGSEATAKTNLEADTSTNWVRQIERTEEGGFRIGNPDAPVKLVEYSSFSCPHCAAFHEEALTPMKGEYISSGKVSFEFRPFVRNPQDLIATAVTTCQKPEGFFALADAFFENQEGWLGGFSGISEADQQRVASLPREQQLVEIGRLGNVDDFVRPRGISSAKFESCVNDPKALALAEKVMAEGRDIGLTGTPTFVLNGEKIDASNWDQVKSKLDAAL